MAWKVYDEITLNVTELTKHSLTSICLKNGATVTT